jgi:hypothetical protein
LHGYGILLEPINCDSSGNKDISQTPSRSAMGFAARKSPAMSCRRVGCFTTTDHIAVAGNGQLLLQALQRRLDVHAPVGLTEI